MPTKASPTSILAIFSKPSKALKSPRRLANIASLNDLPATPMKLRIPDPYGQCEQLNDWDLYAVDGHYHHAACFDKKSLNPKGELRAIATGHFFRMRMTMRTHPPHELPWHGQSRGRQEEGP